MKTHSLLQYLVLSFLVALPMMATDILLPALPAIATELQATEIQIKYILVVYMIGFATSILSFGIISDKYGRKPCIKVSLAIFLITTLLCCLINDVYQLIGLRFLQAFGAGSMTVLVRAVIRDCYDETTSVVVLSTMSAVMTLSTLLAPLIGSLLFEQFGWRAILLFLIAIAGLVSLFVEKQLPNSQISNRNLNLFDWRYFASLIKIAWKSKPFVGYTLIISFIWSAFFCFVVESSFLFQNVFKLNPTIFAIFFSIISLGYMMGSMTSRKLILKHSSDSLILLGLSLATLSMLLGCAVMWFAFDPYVVLVATFIFLAGCGLIVPNCQSRSLAQFSNNIGFYASIFYAVEMFTTGIVSALKTQLHLDGLANFGLMLGLAVVSLWIFYQLCWNSKRSV